MTWRGLRAQTLRRLNKTFLGMGPGVGAGVAPGRS